MYQYHSIGHVGVDETEGSRRLAPQGLKTTKNFDGATDAIEAIENTVISTGVRLHAQLTRDPLDPLNWSRWRKLVILGIVMWK
jgi:hypothetical protein